eukprot:3392414-Prymnesium_polylepis.2
MTKVYDVIAEALNITTDYLYIKASSRVDVYQNVPSFENAEDKHFSARDIVDIVISDVQKLVVSVIGPSTSTLQTMCSTYASTSRWNPELERVRPDSLNYPSGTFNQNKVFPNTSVGGIYTTTTTSRSPTEDYAGNSMPFNMSWPSMCADIYVPDTSNLASVLCNYFDEEDSDDQRSSIDCGISYASAPTNIAYIGYTQLRNIRNESSTARFDISALAEHMDGYIQWVQQNDLLAELYTDITQHSLVDYSHTLILRCPLCLNLSKYMPSSPNVRGDVRLVAMHVDTNSSSISTLTVRPIPITMAVSPPRTPALPSLPRRIGRFRTSAFRTVPQDDNLDA